MPFPSTPVRHCISMYARAKACLVFVPAGIVKTHRLSLNPMTDPLSPSMPDPSLETVITVGPKTMKSMLEHFPFGKGSKSDPQLVWNFHDEEVVLRSLESGADGKGSCRLFHVSAAALLIGNEYSVTRSAISDNRTHAQCDGVRYLRLASWADDRCVPFARVQCTYAPTSFVYEPLTLILIRVLGGFRLRSRSQKHLRSP